MKKRLFFVLIVFCLVLTLLPATAFATGETRTLLLNEDWRLSNDLDLNVPAGTTLIIDGNSTFYIYEMGGSLLNNGAGSVVLEHTILYPAGGTPIAPVSIITPDLPSARVGWAYSQTIAFAKSYIAGGAVTFSAIGLPAGLTINESTGLISGTPVSGANASSPYSVEVTASAGVYTGTKTYSLSVASASTGNGNNNRPTPVATPVATGGQKLAIPASFLSNPTGGGTMTLNAIAGSVTVPSNMLASVAGAEGKKAEIVIGQGDKSNLPADVKNAIGDRPVISLSLTLDGVQTDWSSPDTPVTVNVPYTPTAAELANPEGIVVWYIDGSGNAVCVPNGRYDAATGKVTFDVTHFSDYAVVYNSTSFGDVPAGVWYYKAVSFITARDITTGTGGGNFSPDTKLTRGQFLVMLMKTYEIVPDKNPVNNFSDAGNTYYTGYLAAAKRLGITDGIGNNMFAPEKEITRQEMFALLYNVLGVIGQIPDENSSKALTDFTDADQIAPWANEALTALVKAGTVSGSNGALTPAGTTTRAEMAQALYNLLKN